MRRYLIRSDLPAHYQPKVDALAQAISQHTDFHVEQVQVSSQVSQFAAQDFNVPVISLDKRFQGDYDLRVSRLFYSYLLTGDEQSMPIGITARPGPEQVDLTEQISKIPAGEYVLVDDDSASGFTLDQVNMLLDSHGVIVREDHLLSNHQAEGYEDIIDASDFIAPYAHEGGLVVLVGHEPQRYSYLSRHVNLMTRATLPNSLKETIRAAVAQVEV